MKRIGTQAVSWGALPLLFGLSLSATAGCLEPVVVGDPVFVVVEKCGSPERRERYEESHTKPVEVLRGNTSLREYPVPPKVTEKWYYDTTLDAATVITIEDSGVTRKERLTRQGKGEEWLD